MQTRRNRTIQAEKESLADVAFIFKSHVRTPETVQSAGHELSQSLFYVFCALDEEITRDGSHAKIS